MKKFWLALLFAIGMVIFSVTSVSAETWRSVGSTAGGTYLVDVDSVKDASAFAGEPAKSMWVKWFPPHGSGYVLAFFLIPRQHGNSIGIGRSMAYGSRGNLLDNSGARLLRDFQWYPCAPGSLGAILHQSVWGF